MLEDTAPVQRLSWVPSELQTHGEGPGATRECWFPTLCSAEEQDTEEFLPPASQHSSGSSVCKQTGTAQCRMHGNRLLLQKKKIF